MYRSKWPHHNRTSSLLACDLAKNDSNCLWSLLFCYLAHWSIGPFSIFFFFLYSILLPFCTHLLHLVWWCSVSLSFLLLLMTFYSFYFFLSCSNMFFFFLLKQKEVERDDLNKMDVIANVHAKKKKKLVAFFTIPKKNCMLSIWAYTWNVVQFNSINYCFVHYQFISIGVNPMCYV